MVHTFKLTGRQACVWSICSPWPPTYLCGLQRWPLLLSIILSVWEVSNQRSVFILTLDICLDVSRGRTRRLRLEWEKEDRRMGHWYREVLASAASRGICCFVSQAGLSMSEQIQFIRQVDMQNQNSTLPLLALVTLKNKDGVIDEAKCNNRESTLMPHLHFAGKSDSALGTK